MLAPQSRMAVPVLAVAATSGDSSCQTGTFSTGKFTKSKTGEYSILYYFFLTCVGELVLISIFYEVNFLPNNLLSRIISYSFTTGCHR